MPYQFCVQPRHFHGCYKKHAASTRHGRGDEPVKINEQDTIEGVKVCEKSIVGRVLTRKPVNKEALEAAFGSIWENPSGFRVEEIRPRIFQVFFEKEDDLQRVLSGGP